MPYPGRKFSEIMKRLFSFLFFVGFSLPVFAQQRMTIFILNEVSKAPVEAATIAFAGGSSFTANANGMVLLQANSIKTSTAVTVTATGYQARTQNIAPGKNEVTIYLLPMADILQPVEVNAIRAGERSPFAKTNLSKAFIEKNNFGQDLPFLLNQTPNVVINSDAGNGVGYTGIRIRGTDATRINTTINGLPYNDAESQGTFFVDLPDFASSVSSIQVQRGVGTSSNGAGAFGASVNFSTNEYKPVPYLNLNNSYGSFNTWKNTLRFGSGLIGKYFTIDTRVSNITSDGYIERAKTSLQSGYVSAAYQNKKTSFRLNVLLGKEKTYQAWDGVPQSLLPVNRRYNGIGTEKSGTPYENETDNYWQNHFQLFFTRQLNAGWDINTALFYTPGHGYYEQYRANEKLSDYGINPFIIGTDTTTRTDLVRRRWLDTDFFGQVFSIQQKTAKHQFTLGGGWNRHLGDHFGEVIWTKQRPLTYNRYYANFANKTDVNVYAKWQQQLNSHLDIFMDLQYRYVHYAIGGFDKNPTLYIKNNYQFVNPKAGISYRKGNWSGFASYAVANKEPNRDDFEADLLKQPKPEQLHDIELNARRSNIIPGLTLGATGYYMLYRNQLVLTGQINDVGAYERTNIPHSYRLGVEVEAAYQSKFWNAAYSISLSRNKIKNFTEYVNDYDNGGLQTISRGNPDIAFSPFLVQNIMVNILPVKNAEFTIMGKQVSRQYLDNTGDKARSLHHFLVNDARVSYLVKSGWLKEMRIALQVNNLFDVKYEPNGYTFSYIYNKQYTYENFYFPMAGRNFMVMLNISL